MGCSRRKINNLRRPDKMRAKHRKIFLLATIVGAALLLRPMGDAYAQKSTDLKIGVVNFQTVLTTSEAGKRSRKILLASKGQKEAELRAIGEQIKKEREELENNILLTASAKTKKQKELRERESQWRKEFKIAERELQKKQIKVSETIYSELKTVINLVATEKNFDFIIEQSNAQTILYSRRKLIDLTAEVIDKYNNISK